MLQRLACGGHQLWTGPAPLSPHPSSQASHLEMNETLLIKSAPPKSWFRSRRVSREDLGIKYIINLLVFPFIPLVFALSEIIILTRNIVFFCTNSHQQFVPQLI